MNTINKTDLLKSWVMTALTLIFVILYAAALLGWIKPLTDITMITRLEPMIFVIIGYYFGRLPAQQNEKTLRDEISRQTQKADATLLAKEQIQQERDLLEEKTKNAEAALSLYSFNKSAVANTGKTNLAKTENNNGAFQNSINTTLSILRS